MMYGFGDTADPLQETTDLVEDMTIDYITNFVSAIPRFCEIHASIVTLLGEERTVIVK